MFPSLNFHTTILLAVGQLFKLVVKTSILTTESNF